MTQAYNDFYMRDYPGDNGDYPSSSRVTVSHSPDIIPAGTSATPDYENFYKNNYNGPYEYYRNVSLNAFNYIYVRSKNLGSNGNTGTINLYYALPTLLLMPSVWINNQIPNSNSTNSADLEVTNNGDVCTGVGPFYWSPPPLPSSDNHYCLIAQVITAQHPNPIPSDDNLRDFAAWVRNKPAVAWRNVSLVTQPQSPAYQNFVGIENPDASPVLATITATCINIPDNTEVKIFGPISGPQPPINKTEAVGPGNQTSSNPKTNIISLVTTLPANFKEKLELTATLPNGVNPPPGSQITLSYFLNVSNDDSHAKYGFEAAEIGLNQLDLGVRNGPGRMLLLGDYTFEFRIT